MELSDSTFDSWEVYTFPLLTLLALQYQWIAAYKNIWVISSPCEYLQTLGLLGQLTVSMYLFIKNKLLENQFLTWDLKIGMT